MVLTVAAMVAGAGIYKWTVSPDANPCKNIEKQLVEARTVDAVGFFTEQYRKEGCEPPTPIPTLTPMPPPTSTYTPMPPTPVLSVSEYYDRGLFYERNKQLSRAVTEFSTVIRLEPNHPNAYLKRGKAYLKLNEGSGNYDIYQHVLQDYNMHIQLNPADAKAHASRAELYNTMGKKRPTIEDLEKVLELDSDWIPKWGYVKLIVWYDSIGESDKADAVESKACLNLEIYC